MARLSRSRFTHEDAPLLRLRLGKDRRMERMRREGCIRRIARGSPAVSCRVDDKLSYKLNTSEMKMHYPDASFTGGGRH